MIVNYKCYIIVLLFVFSSLFIPCKAIYTKLFFMKLFFDTRREVTRLSYHISLVLIDIS